MNDQRDLARGERHGRVTAPDWEVEAANRLYWEEGWGIDRIARKLERNRSTIESWVKGHTRQEASANVDKTRRVNRYTAEQAGDDVVREAHRLYAELGNKTEVARRIGVSRTTLHNWLTGERRRRAKGCCPHCGNQIT